MSTSSATGRSKQRRRKPVALRSVRRLHGHRLLTFNLGLVTGVGHARLIIGRFGKFWGAFAVGDQFLLNFPTIVAEFIGVSLGIQYFGVSLLSIALTLPGPKGVGFFFHAGQSRVVVRELIDVRPGDFPSRDGIVMGHIGSWVVGAMFHLDPQAGAKLLQIDIAPVDAQRLTNPASFVDRKLLRRHPLLLVTAYVCCAALYTALPALHRRAPVRRTTSTSAATSASVVA